MSHRAGIGRVLHTTIPSPDPHHPQGVWITAAGVQIRCQPRATSVGGVLRGSALLRHRPDTALICGAIGALVAAGVWLVGLLGGDAPAHLFQTWLFSHASFQLWNNDWYSGRYDFVSYSLLYYPLASVVGERALTVVAAFVLAGSFCAVVERQWGGPARAPAVAFAVLTTFATMAAGAFPFLAGAASASLALALIQRRRRVGFGVCAAVTLAFSPLALALLVALLAGLALGDPHPREVIARNRLALGAVGAVLLVGVLAQRVFPSGGWYPFSLNDAAEVLAFSLAGIWMAGKTQRARPLRAVFIVYLVLNVGAFAVHGPLGANTTRLMSLAGLPLLWLASNVGRRSARLAIPVLLIATMLQMGPIARQAYAAWVNPSDSAAFWRPAVEFLKQQGDNQNRVEVVATADHWEAYYLAKRGIPLARGWFRQDDFPQNQVLYAAHLTGFAYRNWLRSLGVRYVVLPNAPLDPSAVQEAALLQSGDSGLDLVERTGNLTIFQLPDPTSIVSGPPGASGRLVSLANGQVRFHASAPGRYVVRVRFSPYWTAQESGVCIAESADGMMDIDVAQAGPVDLQMQPGVESMAEALIDSQDPCPISGGPPT